MRSFNTEFYNWLSTHFYFNLLKFVINVVKCQKRFQKLNLAALNSMLVAIKLLLNVQTDENVRRNLKQIV